MQTSPDKKLRSLYNDVDNAIGSELISNIVSLNGNKRSFSQKLLGRQIKFTHEELIENGSMLLPDFIEKIRGKILNNNLYKDKEGKNLISPEALNLMLYERISLKFGKRFKLVPDTIDSIFSEANSKIVDKAEKQLSEVKNDGSEAIKSAYKVVQEKLKSAIPPHLINFPEKEDSLFYSLNKNSVYSILKDHQLQLENQLSLAKNRIESRKDASSSDLAVRSIEAILKLENHITSKQFPDKPMDKETREIYEQELEFYKARNYQQLKESNIKRKSFPKKHLTKFEIEGISLMDKMYHNKLLSPSEQSFLASFFEYATDNKTFNKRIGRIKKLEGLSYEEEPNLKKSIYDMLHKYSFKTKDMKYIAAAAEKLENLVNTLDKDINHKFSDDEKISARELGKIAKFIDNSLMFDNIVKLNRILYSPALNRIIEIKNKCQEFDKKFKDKIKNSASQSQSGDLVVDIAVDYQALYGYKKDFSTRITNWITPYSHAAVIVREGEELKKSHVWNNYTLNAHGAKNIVISKGFRILPDKLIYNKDIRKKLSEVFNVESEEALAQKIQSEYQIISDEMHEKNEFNSKDVIKNDAVKRINAGIADFKIGGHKRKESVRSWAERVGRKADATTIGAALSEDSNKEMICSEFAAKMTVLTLRKLDQELIKKIQEKDPEFKIPAKGILKMPFNKHEDLSKIHPYRLIKQLQIRKVVVPIENALVENVVRRKGRTI
jgi:hypothetical protein